MAQTTDDAFDELQESVQDLMYGICKAAGVIWLAKRLPFLELKGWVKKREAWCQHSTN